jgi:hypothetical protein
VTGAYTRGDGVGSDDVVIKINGKVDTRTKFVYGEKVEFQFPNIAGLTKENGKFFPAMSMSIIKNGKDTVYNQQELLTEIENGTDLSPLTVQSEFFATLPFENNETYKALIKIKDKKGKGTFEYELPFTVQKNNLISVKPTNLTYSKIYLWDETDKIIMANKNINTDHLYVLIFEGVDGFVKTNTICYPALSTDIIDSKGNPILSKANVFESYKDSGVSYEKIKDQKITVELKFGSGVINNPCKFKASLTDLKSNNRIDVEADLEFLSYAH